MAWEEARPVSGGGRGGEGSEGNESKERGLRSETIVLFHCGGSEKRSPSAVIDAPKTKGLPLDKKNNVASLPTLLSVVLFVFGRDPTA